MVGDAYMLDSAGAIGEPSYGRGLGRNEFAATNLGFRSARQEAFHSGKLAIDRSEFRDEIIQMWSLLEENKNPSGFEVAVAPSAEQWLIAFSTRFNLATKNLFCASVNWAVHRCTSLLPSLAPGIGQETSSKRFAVGLLCLGFITANLLDPSALNIRMVNRRNDGQEFNCQVSARGQQNLIQFLEMATGSSKDELTVICQWFLARVGADAEPNASPQVTV